ncbi:hypothetical protein AJ80_00144 [Polytolypa hystricis UAMH7299]|uniref:Uncharacterized protein n=1 Tax=Polytolypa hystricis (strain UAMH7299) TaxID=1447883 RepID=A0A2B7Z4U0_POLH7|nr:hypothetical protein AJ80_00144 [Polytolypa hystricis UAMH7299]
MERIPSIVVLPAFRRKTTSLRSIHVKRISPSGFFRVRFASTTASRPAGEIVRKSSTAATTTTTTEDSALYPTPRQHEKERIMILGSGWGGYTLSRKLSSSKFSATVISPRSYFVFTPLLTDAAVGSLNFSEIVEPVRDRRNQIDFLQASARKVDFERKVITCQASVVRSGVTESARVEQRERKFDEGPETGPMRGKEHLRKWEEGQVFEVPYDKLIISVGCASRTFDTPGVRENAFFFKDIGDARRVKRRIRECFELALMPTTSPEMRRHLLHFAIVGAGPTGTELAAALCDFLHEDIVKVYPELKGQIRVTLYDVGPTVLSMFDESLSKYAMKVMKREGVTIKMNRHIQALRWGQPGQKPPYDMDPKGCLTLDIKEEGEVGVGMCVWATGNEMNKFVNNALGPPLDTFPVSSAFAKDTDKPVTNHDNTSWSIKKAPPLGALLVDKHLHVQLESSDGRTAVLKDVFAIGDNSMLETGSPPATAQATNQEAIWLAKRLNKDDMDRSPGFLFKNLGVLAYLGNSKALMQLPHEIGEEGAKKYLPKGIKGYAAWLIWKGAYLNMSVSWRNRMRMVFSWVTNWIFGRDISRY